MLTAVVLLTTFLTPGQDDKAVEEALDAFKSAYKSNSEPERAAAVTALAKTPHTKTLARLAPLLSSEGTTVRIAAAKGLAGFADLKKPASSALVAALSANAKEPTVLVAILEAIGKLDDDSALPAVHRAFDEKDTPVAKAAIQACGEMKNISSVDALIALLARLEKIQKNASNDSIGFNAGNGSTVRVGGDNSGPKRAQDLIPIVNKALQDITREIHTSSEAWSQWWAKNRAAFKK